MYLIPPDVTDTLQIYINLATFVIVALSAFFALRSIRNSAKANKYLIIEKFLEEYSSIEMYNAIQIINEWIHKCELKSQDYALVFGELRDKIYGDQICMEEELVEFKSVDFARRKITHFMNRMRIFCDNKVISKAELARFVSVGQIDLYLQKVKRFEKINGDSERFDAFFFELRELAKYNDLPVESRKQEIEQNAMSAVND